MGKVCGNSLSGDAGFSDFGVCSQRAGKFVRVPRAFLEKVFDSANQNLTTGNLYFHPNPLLREVFWMRLKAVFRLGIRGGRERVLEVGCGGGELLPSLAGVFSEVVGVDIRPGTARRLVNLLHLSNVEIREGDFLDLPFESSSFDVVIAADVLEHQQDLSRFLKKISEVMKKDGALVTSFPLENFWYRMGRKIFRIPPPEDHYQSDEKISFELRKYFWVEREKLIPFSWFPLFRVFQGVKR